MLDIFKKMRMHSYEHTHNLSVKILRVKQHPQYLHYPRILKVGNKNLTKFLGGETIKRVLPSQEPNLDRRTRLSQLKFNSVFYNKLNLFDHPL